MTMKLTRAIEAEFAQLRAFAQAIMQSWPDGDVDGGELQELAIKHGLLEMKDPAPREPCGESCSCAEYYLPEDFAAGDVQCYVKTLLDEKETSEWIA